MRSINWRWAIGALLLAMVQVAVAAAGESEFRSLFDGQTLAGWQGDERVFRVQEGAIVAGTLAAKIAHNDFLASTDEFGDFELRLKARLLGKGQNAGIQFRSQRIDDHFEMIGYQCDMGTADGKPIWGALYDESRRRKFLVLPDAEPLNKVLQRDDWNELVIRCEGPRVQIWVNGQQTVDYTETDDSVPAKGRLGLQIHGGEPAQASYKDIRIKTLDRK